MRHWRKDISAILTRHLWDTLMSPRKTHVSCSVVSDSATRWTAARQASLSITNSQSLLKLVSIESAMPSNHLILCRPLLLLPSIFPSIRVFSNEFAHCIRWPKYWSFSISPSNEYSGLISFRMNWFDLLAVPGTSREPSPTPQFKSISSSALSFFYSPTLTSVHDSWKNHSCENADPGQQSDVSAPLISSALCILAGILWAARGCLDLLLQSRQMKGEICLGQSFCKC